MRRVAGFMILAGLGVLSMLSQTFAKSNTLSLSDVEAMIAEDSKKVRFVGSRNGVVFRKQVTLSDLGCSEDVKEAPEELVEGSPLNFTPTFLPIGYSLQEEVRYQCDGKLVYLARVYRGKDGELTIVRSAGHTVLSLAPTDRMFDIETAAGNGVWIRDLPSPGTPKDLPTEQWRSWRVIIADEVGHFDVRSNGVTWGEGMKLVDELGGN